MTPQAEEVFCIQFFDGVRGMWRTQTCAERQRLSAKLEPSNRVKIRGAKMNHENRKERPAALVTGASAGIGLAFAEALAARGYDLWLVARRTERLREIAEHLAAKYSIRTSVLARDLCDAMQRHDVEALLQNETSIELLVNNAGFGTTGAFFECDLKRETAEIELNVLALVRLTHAILPRLVARRHGGVINVSSIASFQCGPYNAVYAASKAFVTSFSEALAAELIDTNLCVQALCPGFTRTEFHAFARWNTDRVPSLAWLSAQEVVEASLRAYAQKQVLCVPGFHYRLLALGSQWAPRALRRRILAKITRLIKEQ